MAKHKGLLKTLLLTGLVAGTLDGIAATAHFGIMSADNPIRVFNYVASGVFGKEAYTAGYSFTMLGIAIHYVIAMIWTAIYFNFYPFFRSIFGKWWINGLAYGAVVWTCMNLIVLPLSNTPARTFSLHGVLISLVIIIFCIGMPIAFSSHRFFSN